MRVVNIYKNLKRKVDVIHVKVESPIILIALVITLRFVYVHEVPPNRLPWLIEYVYLAIFVNDLGRTTLPDYLISL